MSAFVWVMTAMAVWHVAPLLPDRFWGGIVGALLLILAGGIASGVLLSGLTIPADNPPGVVHVALALPGSLAAFGASWLIGVARERQLSEA